jgi:ribonucleoside-diphosphate reductase alpha chain
MGFAELLIELGIPYASAGAVALAEELMGFIAERAGAASARLAEARGVFPNWHRSVHRESGRRLRHATCTSIAPTGSISIVAGTSASVEPLFALAYRRRALGGQNLPELSPLFMRHARQAGVDSDALRRALARGAEWRSLPGVPSEAGELFRTALEIGPEDHLAIQAAFQKHVDNAVSKTINMPETATAGDVAAIYVRAWELGLKGITVYRYGSRAQQVLELGLDETADQHEHFARCDPHECRL